MTKAFALTNLSEVLLWFLFIVNKGLRDQFVHSLTDSRVLLTMIFWGWIAISMSWGEAPVAERLADWSSWRKLSLVPICFVVFRSHRAKSALAASFLVTCTVFMFLSWLGHFELVTLDTEPTRLIENHSTQGVLFAASGFLTYLMSTKSMLFYKRALLWILMVGFFANIFFVTIGRSGYVFLIVCCYLAAFFTFPKRFRAGALLVPVLVVSGLMLSSASSQRITEAVTEMSTAFSVSESYTSLGIRMVMWSNTIRMIEEKPFFGSGAGSFKYDYSGYVEGVQGWRGTIVDDPHQQYLHIAAEYGLVGLFFFGLAIFTWSCVIFKAKDIYVIFAIGVLMATLANSFANGHFSSFVEGRLVWICLAGFLAGTPDIFNNAMSRIIGMYRNMMRRKISRGHERPKKRLALGAGSMVG